MSSDQAKDTHKNGTAVDGGRNRWDWGDHLSRPGPSLGDGSGGGQLSEHIRKVKLEFTYHNCNGSQYCMPIFGQI